MLDEHFYQYSKEFYADVGHYDHYDRKGPKIFVGEWATVEGSPTPTFEAALGDAAWMTGMERNSDIVIMQAYAPLLVNVNKGAFQWQTNLIGYDAVKSYGCPSYYAQVMFNTHRGDQILSSSTDVAPGFFSSVTRDSKTGTVFVKAVNTNGVQSLVRIAIEGTASIEPQGKAIVLTGKPDESNSLQEPEKIIPVESAISGVSAGFEHSFPAFSVTVWNFMPIENNHPRNQGRSHSTWSRLLLSARPFEVGIGLQYPELGTLFCNFLAATWRPQGASFSEGIIRQGTEREQSYQFESA